MASKENSKQITAAGAAQGKEMVVGNEVTVIDSYGRREWFTIIIGSFRHSKDFGRSSAEE